jgi:hypothetical protein
MATVALTNIKHGTEEGTMIEIEAGEKVSKSDLPEGVYDELKENGAIGNPPVALDDDTDAAELAAQNDDLQKRVAELEAQLADAKGSGGAPKQTSGTQQQGSTGAKSTKQSNVNPPAAG